MGIAYGYTPAVRTISTNFALSDFEFPIAHPN
jgi:hypothetical protein